MKLSLSMVAATLALTLAFPVNAAQVDNQKTVYAVTHIAPSDTLNVRSGPSVTYPVVAVLPANGKGVIATGRETETGNSVWTQITWAGAEGWVNKYYLVEDTNTSTYQPGKPQPTTPSAKKVVMSCVGVEPRWNIYISATSVNVMTESAKFTVPVTFRQQSANQSNIAVVAGRKGAQAAQVFLQKVEACAVGGRSYPYNMTAVLDERQVVSGCCKVLTQ